MNHSRWDGFQTTNGSVAPCHSGSSNSGAGAWAMSIRGGVGLALASAAIATPSNRIRIAADLPGLYRFPIIRYARFQPAGPRPRSGLKENSSALSLQDDAERSEECQNRER